MVDKDYPREIEKCNRCGAEMFYFYEAYCLLGHRGANSGCSEHKDKLICGDCAEIEIRGGYGRIKQILNIWWKKFWRRKKK